MHFEQRVKGISAALSSAAFLGMAPIFGKLAIGFGFSPLAVIAVRTTVAALLMAALIVLKMRSYVYIFPVGLAGCLLAGFINGCGSILYYTALSRLDAGVGHVLYSFYPVFVALWLLLDRQSLSRLTLVRLLLTLPAVVLMVLPGDRTVDPLGMVMMLGSAILYALHMLINQRILYEAPAQTVTLYTLLAMAGTVDIAFLIGGARIQAPDTLWWPLLAMALITFFSRLTLFLGIKHLGGLQTALLGLAELFVTVVLAQLWLGEHFSPTQWAGAGLLGLCLLLVRFEKMAPEKSPGAGWMSWLKSPEITQNDFPWSSQP